MTGPRAIRHPKALPWVVGGAVLLGVLVLGATGLYLTGLEGRVNHAEVHVAVSERASCPPVNPDPKKCAALLRRLLYYGTTVERRAASRAATRAGRSLSPSLPTSPTLALPAPTVRAPSRPPPARRAPARPPAAARPTPAPAAPAPAPAPSPSIPEPQLPTVPQGPSIGPIHLPCLPVICQ